MTDVVVQLTNGKRGSYPITLHGEDLNAFEMETLWNLASRVLPGIKVTYRVYRPLPDSLDAKDLLFGGRIAQDAVIEQLRELGVDRPEDVMRYRTEGDYLVATFACEAGEKKHKEIDCPWHRHQPPFQFDDICTFETSYRVRLP